MKKTLPAFVLFAVVFLLSALAAGQAAAPNLDDQLFDAVQKGDATAAGQLLDQGANANAQGSTGETPLIVACAMGYVDVVKLLLDKAAKPQRWGRLHPAFAEHRIRLAGSGEVAAGPWSQRRSQGRRWVHVADGGLGRGAA